MCYFQAAMMILLQKMANFIIIPVTLNMRCGWNQKLTHDTLGLGCPCESKIHQD